MRRWVSVSLGLVLSAGVAMSQEVPPPPGPVPATPAAVSCEAQVQDHHKKLVTDGLLTAATAPQWGPQLTALVHKVRTGNNQLLLKKQQADGFEQSVVELAEQLRLAREEAQMLRAELEKLRTKAAPAN